MPLHFSRYVARAQSPGVILLRAAIPISTAIDELALIWNAGEVEEWFNRLVWIPPLRLGLVRLREAGAAGIAGISLLQSQGQK